jgi:hypothetical protein
VAKRIADYQLIRWEFYNSNKFDVVFTLKKEMLTYIAQQGISVGRAKIVCKPDEFVVLNHSYYDIQGVGLRNGDPIQGIRNYGDAIGKGNKLPSRPLTEKDLFAAYGKRNR